jgi:hypothetical protein
MGGLYLNHGWCSIDPGLIFFHRSPRQGGLSVPEMAGVLKRGPGAGGGGTDKDLQRKQKQDLLKHWCLEHMTFHLPLLFKSL